MIQLVTSIVCLVLVALFGLHVYKHASAPANIMIQQIEYIRKENFDSLVSNHQPIVVRKVDEQLPMLYLPHTETDPVNPVSYVSSLHSRVSFNHKFALADKFRNIYTTHHDRTFIIQLKSETIVRLYPPSQKSLLYCRIRTNGYDVSSANVKDPNVHKKFPLLHKSKFISVRLKKGNMLFVPSLWSFYMEDSTNSAVSTSSTIASEFVYRFVI